MSTRGEKDKRCRNNTPQQEQNKAESKREEGPPAQLKQLIVPVTRKYSANQHKKISRKSYL